MANANVTFWPVVSTDTHWPALREAEMRNIAECAPLTAYRYILVGPQSPPGGGFVADAAVEGGGVLPPAGVTRSYMTNSIFQTPRSGAWAIEYRFKFSSPAAAHSTDIGIANGAGTHIVAISSNATTDATKYFIIILGGATTTSTNQTVVNDGGWHNGRLTFNAAESTPTLRAYIDNVLAASTTTLTNLADEPMGAYMDITAGSSTIVSEFIYGFVKP